MQPSLYVNRKPGLYVDRVTYRYPTHLDINIIRLLEEPVLNNVQFDCMNEEEMIEGALEEEMRDRKELEEEMRDRKELEEEMRDRKEMDC